MKQKLPIILILAIAISMVSLPASAELANPTTLGAPQQFGVSHYYGDSCNFTFSVPDDIREYIKRRADENPENWQSLTLHYQIDYKIDNGNWHYTKEWDNNNGLSHTPYFTFINGKYYTSSERWSLSSLFPEDEQLVDFKNNAWDYFKNHSITFRARFIETFDYGKTYVCSGWSNEYTLSSKMTGEPDKMINHAPELQSVSVNTTSGGEPYFEIRTGKPPEEILKLHSMANSAVMTEIWMRKKGESDFKYIFYEWASWEYIKVDARDYFDSGKQSYDEESYEIKIRYALDMKNYKQSDQSGTIYGPFSKVISHNMPAWSAASQWATGEVQKAVDNGLYPEKLQGADLTRPITRAEFAAVALKLYEALSGTTAAPAPENTFTDTRDTDVLKAYALDIVAGVGNNKFAPDDYVNREQAATMLTRVYKKLKWEGWTLAADSTYTKHSLDNKGVPPFADDAQISDWAKPSVYFMAKYEIIKGLGDNKFAPKNTTSAEVAAGYANATREQALAISNRTFEKAGIIQDGGPVTGNTEQPAQTSSDSIVGSWVLGDLTGGTFNRATGKYEGGATGLGQLYTFRADGTYTALVIWSNTMFFTGKYSLKDGKLVLTERFVEESNDGGKTWSAKEALPDSGSYYTIGTDESGKYLLIGEEGAALPLVDKKNAMKYKAAQ